MVLRAFVFGRSAVLVFPWYEPSPDGGERGVRVELRLLRPTAARGSRSAAQELCVDQPLWRADLFDLIDGPTANMARAHFHFRFEGVEPSDRCWDEQLSRDAFTWLADQLSDLGAIVAASQVDVDGGLSDGLAADAVELAGIVREIVQAATGELARARAGHRR